MSLLCWQHLFDGMVSQRSRALELAASCRRFLAVRPDPERVFVRLTVAGIIALAPLGGAVAAGASRAGLFATALPCAFAFLGIMYREIIMVRGLRFHLTCCNCWIGCSQACAWQ